MDMETERPLWTRVPVLPRKFCFGVNVHTSMFIIGWFFFISGIMLLIGFSYGFSHHNYYSQEAEDIVDFTKSRLTMKIEEGFLLSILVTTGLSVGILLDFLLLWGLAKRRLRVVAGWACVLVLRTAFWMTVGSLLWTRCIRGGRMCFLLLPAALVWVCSLGVFTVAFILAYSHIFYLMYDTYLEQTGDGDKVPTEEDLSSSV